MNSMVKYRVIVDRNTCIACGAAPGVCSQVFILGEDNGKNRVVDVYSEKISEDTSVGIVSEDLYNCVKQGVEVCPVQAITVEKIGG